MTVKDLIVILKKANPENEVYCGYERDNPFEACSITGAFEIMTLPEPSASDMDDVQSGLYLRMG